MKTLIKSLLLDLSNDPLLVEWFHARSTFAYTEISNSGFQEKNENIQGILIAGLWVFFLVS